MNKLNLLLILIILIVTGVLRFYKISQPIADWHSWRQADTAAVARNFIRFGFDPLHPRYDDLSNIQSGKDNPQGFRMVEFPIYQLIGATAYNYFPLFSIEMWLRLVTISASMGIALMLYLIVRKYTNSLTGLLTAFFYAVLPYSIYYGRTILPETFASFWALLSLYLLSKKSHALVIQWLYFVGAAITCAVALLVKPTAIFLLIPAIYLFLKHFSFSLNWFIGVLVYWSIGLLPLVLWRNWIMQFPEGIPAYLWLLNSNNIRFKGAWFNWLFAERISKLILGYWGIIIVGIGSLVKPEKKEGWYFVWWIIGALAYLVVFAAGNVQHDYYQILLLPVISIYLAKGMSLLINNSFFPRINGYILASVSVLFMLAFSWYQVRGYYWINRPEIVEAGRMADQLLPKNAKVIAPYNGDTTFLYQTNRQGWPIGFDREKKLEMGATAYVTVSPKDEDWETFDLARRFTVLVRNDRYAIIDLTKPSPNAKNIR